MKTANIALAAGLLITGCSDRDPVDFPAGADGTTGGGPTVASSTGIETTTGLDGASGSGSVVIDCQSVRPLPPAPVDCSGADVVYEGDFELSEGMAPPPTGTLIRVDGDVAINGSAMVDLNFLACVEEISGSLTIFGNDHLTNVDGLHGLRVLGSDLVFSENSAIVDFSGLPQIEVVPQNVIIKNNDALESISGFHRLETIGGNLTIQSNDVLWNIDGLGGLRILGGWISVTANPQMCRDSLHCVGEGIEQAQPPPDSGPGPHPSDGGERCD